MKKINRLNLNILIKGFFISAIPFIIIHLEAFSAKRPPFNFLCPCSYYEIFVAGIIGVISSYGYILFKKRNKELSKKIVKLVIVVYYLLFLFYLAVVIFFRIQTPLLS